MPRPKPYATRTDPRVATRFVVACEGAKTEEIYLAFMTAGLRRVDLLALPTGLGGESAPRHLLERLQGEAHQSAPNAQFWMVLDADHHFEGRHAIETHRVLNEAARTKIEVAISNPRFELWLLLHLEAVQSCPGDGCEQRLKTLLGSYRHNRYDPRPLQVGLADAIARARALDSAPTERVPPNPGTQMYRLMEAIVNS